MWCSEELRLEAVPLVLSHGSGQLLRRSPARLATASLAPCTLMARRQESRVRNSQPSSMLMGHTHLEMPQDLGLEEHHALWTVEMVAARFEERSWTNSFHPRGKVPNSPRFLVSGGSLIRIETRALCCRVFSLSFFFLYCDTLNVIRG